MSYVNQTPAKKGSGAFGSSLGVLLCLLSAAPLHAQDLPSADPDESSDVDVAPVEEGPIADALEDEVPSDTDPDPIVETVVPEPVLTPEVVVEDAAEESVEDAEGDANTQAEEAEEDEEEPPHRFAFGSYGRVNAASDLNGGLGRSTNIVAYGSRIDEDVYAELELRREDLLAPGIYSKVVATLALSGPLFHLDGDFDEQLAVRNLFAEIRGALLPGLSIWAGSRMVRGDDVYLLNWWPLDNLNIVGGGAAYRYKNLLSFRLHVGIGRPRDPFYLQTRDVVARRGFDPVSLSLLDRPRVVTALRTTISPISTPNFGVKLVLYGEVHNLPAGQRTTENGSVETLPNDSGYLIGAQVGLWRNRGTARPAVPRSNGTHTERSFVNIFARYARGLAAYDTFDAPFRRGRVVPSDSAREALVAISANFEYSLFGVQLGAYYRSFRDADVNTFGGGAFNEGAINIRPQVFFGDFAGVSVDFSYQALALAALDERSGQALRGGVTKIGIIPFISLAGRGTFARPRLRLIYNVSLRDEGAQALYPVEDPRSGSGVEHFIGIGAEWWFDSTSYAL
ncbi:MAG: carbohydrate porin [Polyangiales bacterium]